MEVKRFNNFFVRHNTIHSRTKNLMTAAKIFGLVPVSGLFKKSPVHLRVSKNIPYLIIVVLSIAAQMCMCVLALINFFEAGLSHRTFQKFMVHLAGFVCSVFIPKMAKSWPSVVHEVTLIEKSLPRCNRKHVNIICNVSAAFVFLCAILDYVFSIRFYLRLTDACPQGDSQSVVESYYRYTMPAAAKYIPFSIYTFLLTQISYVQVLFVINFADAFIIIISVYLSAYFEELNDLVKLYKDKSPTIWNVLRAHYTKLTLMVKIVDENISPFVLSSFGLNMIIICIQLFKIIRRDLAHATGKNCDEAKLHDTINSIDRSLFYNFSIAFMMARALLTALMATRVHTNASAPIKALYEVPSCCYNREARRFIEQMQANTIALSGQHFFYVTRKMILAMVATIFTYELVLLQFSD